MRYHIERRSLRVRTVLISRGAPNVPYSKVRPPSNRKLSLGSRSQGGERTIERLLFVDQTCRLQRRSLYGYLSDVLTGTARGDPVPTLT
jgi:hypothetical protein